MSGFGTGWTGGTNQSARKIESVRPVGRHASIKEAFDRWRQFGRCVIVEHAVTIRWRGAPHASAVTDRIDARGGDPSAMAQARLRFFEAIPQDVHVLQGETGADGNT